MSPVRALRLGLARAAAQLLELPLQVTELKLSELGIDDLADTLPGDMLLALLDGPEGARGAVALDRALVASLIEVQTIGAVTTLAVTERKLTPTDAAMVAPWLDSALDRVDAALGKEAATDEGGWLTGFRFGAMAADPRALSLALEASGFHQLRLTVDVALGRRTGSMILLLPAAKPHEKPDPEARKGPQEAFLAVPAELSVIAARLSLPLSEAGALKPGDVVPLGGLLMEKAELRTLDGQLAGRAHLGRLGDHWAVRFRSADAGAVAPPVGAPVPLAEPTKPEIAGPVPNLPAVTELPEALPELPPLDFDSPPAGGGAALLGVGTPEWSPSEPEQG